MPRWITFFALAFALGLGTSGCFPGSQTGFCTLQLVFHTVSLVDSDGNPIDDAQHQVRHVRSGTVLDVSDPAVAEPGAYVVVTSHHVMNGPVRNGDVIEVTFTIDGEFFTEPYSVSTDSGPCHPTGIDGRTMIEV